MIILCGIPIILEAVIGLVTEFDIKADVLVSLALIASVLIREDFVAGEVAFIMQLGGLLEELTVAKARAGIEKLVHLTPQTARVLTEAGEKTIPAEQVKVKDILRVLPGETVPVDGVITSGQTSVNQAVMTWLISGEIIRAVTILVVFLSMCTGSGDTDRDHGGNWKCHKAWFSCKRGRCTGASGLC